MKSKAPKIPKGWRKMRYRELCTEDTCWVDVDGQLIPAMCAVGRRIRKDGTISGYYDTAFFRRITKKKARK